MKRVSPPVRRLLLQDGNADMKQENVETIKHVADGVAAVTAIGTVMQFLPAVAALFTIVWTGMRITEMIAGKPFAELIRRKKDAIDE
jgi:hypothetical protein